MVKDAEDRLSLRIDRMEDMQLMASERTNALVNEISALNTNVSVMSVNVTRILKVVDGNGEPSLEKRLLSQEQKTKSVSDTQDNVKGWKNKLVTAGLVAVVTLGTTLLWNKIVAPANQSATVKSQGEAAIKTQGEVKAADERIDTLEVNQKKILESLDALKKTPRGVRPRSRPRPEPTINWNRDVLGNRQPSVPTMAYLHSPLKESQ
jgi:hypothetical protein